MKIIQKDTLKCVQYVRRKRTRPSPTNTIWRAGNGLICKEVIRAVHWSPSAAQKAFEVLADSSYANPVVGLLYDGDQFLGWCEAWIPDLKPLSSRDGLCVERAVYQAHCLYQAHLLDHAHVDIDGGMTNWARDKDGNLFTFDKDKVFCWPGLDCVRNWFGFDHGSYFYLLRRSFSQVSVHFQQQLSDAAMTGDASEFASAYREVADQMGDIS